MSLSARFLQALPKVTLPRCLGRALFVVAQLFALFPVHCAFAAAAAPAPAPKRIILFIGDGMSVPQRMVAEEFSRKAGCGELAMNALPFHAMTRTSSSSSLVTDSAAAATAIACGKKTKNSAVGLDPDGNRLESVAELARDRGKKVGIVTSVTINHATPAGFYAHRAHRSMLYEIGLDLVDSGFDLFMGGGLAGANSRTNLTCYAGDLYEKAAGKGYGVYCGAEGFAALKRDTAALGAAARRVWWRSGEDAMPFAIDAKPADGPRLDAITAFALDYLEAAADPDKGFFIMIEGGRIDWAGHSNDAAANLRDIIELDSAVKVALDFQSAHPDTLIVVTGDHETGGMSMGFAGTGYAFFIERLAAQKSSTDSFNKRFLAQKEALGDKFTFEDFLPDLLESYGFTLLADGAEGSGDDPMALSKDDLDSLRRHFKKGDIADKARRIMQDKAGVGWTSGAHTGLPALTTSSGPGAERFVGLIENTTIASLIKEML